MIRVVIADDERLIRESLQMILSLEDDIEVVATADRGDVVAGLADEHDADVVLLDIDMPGLDGLQTAPALAAARPGRGIIILTGHAKPGYLHRAMRSGVRGFLSKGSMSAAALAEAVRIIHSGGRYIDPELATEAVALGASPLSPRETEIIRLSGDGLTFPDIAERLHLSEGTVRNYMSSAITKLGVANKVAAYRAASAAGWL